MANDLTIGNATYGRSVAGMKALKEDFTGSVNYLKKVLNGDKYTAFKNTVKENWTGADADDFLNDIEKTRTELSRKINALKTTFDAAIDADLRQFKSFQSKNVK